MNNTILATFIALSALVVSCCNTETKTFPMREELLSKTLPEQVEMLQSLAPEEQFDFWKIKLNNTLASKSLSDEEKDLIRPLADALTPKAYQEEETPEGKALKQLSEEISARLKNEYNWSDLKVFKYFETIMTEQEYDEYLKRINREDCQLEGD